MNGPKRLPRFFGQRHPPTVHEGAGQVLSRRTGRRHQPAVALLQCSLRRGGFDVGAFGQFREETLHPRISAALTAQLEHRRGVDYRLVGGLQHAAIGPFQPWSLLVQAAERRKRFEKAHAGIRVRPLGVFNRSTRRKIRVLAAQHIHAHDAHEHGVAGNEQRMPIAKSVVVPPHLVEVVMGESVAIALHERIVVVVEPSDLDAGRPDEAATIAATQVTARQGGNRWLAVDLFEGLRRRADQIGIGLPAAVKPLQEAGHDLTVEVVPLVNSTTRWPSHGVNCVLKSCCCQRSG